MDDYGSTNIAGGFRRSIAHYYGDPVRRFLLLAATTILAALPFYPDLLPLGVPGQILASVTLVVAAALMNPLLRWTLLFGAALSLSGLVISEFAVVSSPIPDTWPLFAVREFLALVFLFSLYFSIKTLRAMALHQTGKPVGT